MVEISRENLINHLDEVALALAAAIGIGLTVLGVILPFLLPTSLILYFILFEISTFVMIFLRRNQIIEKTIFSIKRETERMIPNINQVTQALELFSKKSFSMIPFANRDEMYDLGVKIIKENARQRLIVVQTTPSLLLGARPYNVKLKKNKNKHDQDFVDELDNWIESCVSTRIEKKFCLYIYDTEATVSDIRNKKNDIELGSVEGQIRFYKRKERESAGRFHLSSVSGKLSEPIIVGDNRAAIGITGRTTGLAIQSLEKGNADKLEATIRTLAGDFKDEEKLLDELREGLK